VALAHGRHDRSSPQLAPRVPVRGSGADGVAWCAGGEGQQRFYSGRTDLLATCGHTEDAPRDATPDDREGTAGPWRVARQLGTRGVPGV
jgi:hypothetical protein